MNSEEETKSGYYVYGVKEPQIFETYAEALAYAKEAGETAAREKALEQGAIEISDVIFQEEQQNAMAYGMDLFLGSEVHVEWILLPDITITLPFTSVRIPITEVNFFLYRLSFSSIL